MDITSTHAPDYSKVFNRLCHLVAITQNGKIEKCIDNLVLTLYVIDDAFAPAGIQEIADAVYAYYGLPLDASQIQSSLDRQQSRGAIYRNRLDQKYLASLEARSTLHTTIEEASQLEDRVRKEWLLSLKPLLTDIPKEVEERLWNCLRTYMGKAFQRHGVETIQLLKDTNAAGAGETKPISSYLNDALSTTGLTAVLEQSKAVECIRNFFRISTPERTRYISQLLDGTFSFFALANDRITTEYLRHAITPVSLFLDTNFIFGILDLHTNPLVDISKELIGAIRANKLPFKIYFHEETLAEITRTISSIGYHLKSHKWQQSVSRAAVRMGQMSGFELKYHRLNSEVSTDPAVFMSKYEAIAELLKAEGFSIYRDPPSFSRTEDVVEKSKLINEYQEYIEKRRPKGPKPYEALNHDMTVWRAAQSIRHKGISVLDSGSLILTVDYLFYSFDCEHIHKPDDLGVVVLPNQILQLLRPFIPSTEDFDRRFVETFALPEFRVVDTDYSATCSKVLSYINTYSDISEETATRIIANKILFEQLRGLDEGSEEFKQRIDSALARDNELLLEEKEALARQKEDAESRLQAFETDARIAREALVREERDRERLIGIAKEAQSQAERTAEELKKDIKTLRSESAESQTTTAGLKEQITENQKTNKRLRLYLASVVGLLGVILTISVPATIDWKWLNNHPNRLGIYGCVLFAWLGLAWSIADHKRRNWALSVIVIGAILVLLQIIGK